MNPTHYESKSVTWAIPLIIIHFFTHKLKERLVRQNIYIFLIHFHTSFTVAISRV